jgi:hypothetical protein
MRCALLIRRFAFFTLFLAVLGCAPKPDTRVNLNGMCTLEAKLCPDGSAVGRHGPSCEFAKCPGEDGH